MAAAAEALAVVRNVEVELNRQVQVLVDLDYPRLARCERAAFTDLFEPVRQIVQTQAESFDWSAMPSCVPFLLVVSDRLIRPAELVPLMRLPGGSAPGVLDRNHGDQGLDPYRSLPDLVLPEAPAYVVFGIERGEEFCGIKPADALPVIRDRGRTPLTISEGIALVTLFPESLEKNRCFMLAGSRRGDRRVPAVWISEKAPKLGWCWEGNPHSWLGTASAQSRRG